MGRGGDELARGNTSASFEMPSGVSNQKWTEAFGEDPTESFLERIRKKAIAEGLSEEQFDAQQAAAAAETYRQIAEERERRAAADARIKIRALQDRIIVQRIEASETQNNMFLPDEAKEKPYEGTVVAVGPGVYHGQTFVPVTVNPGDTVVFGKFSGAEVKVGSRDLLVLREEDIYFVKSQETE